MRLLFLWYLTWISSSMFIGPPVHSTSWKLSTCWKFGLYFVYIFIADWNLLTKFCSLDPSFNGNIFTFLYLKSKTSARARLCDYSFIHTIYKFHGTVLAGNSHWGYLLISEVHRSRHECGHVTFPKTFSAEQLLNRNVNFYISYETVIWT